VSSLFLGCFSFGLLFTVATFLLGSVGSLHLPHLFGTSTHAGTGPSGHHGGTSAGAVVNPSTLSAFLMWFGGAGYLLTRYSPLAAISITLLATGTGIVGAGIVFAVIMRYFMPRLTVLAREDFQLEGIVARVSSTIRAGGTGEIVYTLGGTRHVDGARSVTSEALERGTQVIILRIEKGIAYVDRWTKFAEAHSLPPDSNPL
jgi:membrane protein implicated in regulation of membrane protease activity